MMHESKRVPGYRMRNFDEVEFVKEYQDNVEQYEVKGDDLANQRRLAAPDAAHENKFEADAEDRKS
jgi:hypothetical protein